MNIKQKTRHALTLVAAFAVMVGVATFFSPEAKALTDKEVQACANEWGGRSADSDDEQYLNESGFEKFKASACAKGDDPACRVVPAKKTTPKYINCKTAGDGKDATPSVNVVAKRITKDNYKDYTDAKIKKTCNDTFKKAAKRKECIALATEKRDKLKKNDDGGGSSSGLTDPVEGDGCGGVETAIIKCDATNSGDTSDNGVWALLLMVVNILTAGVGLLAVGGIVYGAVLYTTAEDKADQVKKATDIITNVVIGLIAFALMWAGLNFIVPGGVFN